MKDNYIEIQQEIIDVCRMVINNAHFICDRSCCKVKRIKNSYCIVCIASSKETRLIVNWKRRYRIRVLQRFSI